MTDQDLTKIKQLRESIFTAERTLNETNATLSEIIRYNGADQKISLNGTSIYTTKEKAIKIENLFIEMIEGELNRLNKEFESIEIKFN